MRSNAFALLAVAACTALSAAGATWRTQPEPPAAPAAPALRVGTIEPQPIVVAYYRSSVCADHLRELKAEQTAAKARGDTKRVNELEKLGAAMQELAHRQMEGKAPIDSIVERAAPQMAEAAAKANVEFIIEGRVLASPRKVEMVDVTESVLQSLKADDATRRVIAELKAKRKAK